MKIECGCWWRVKVGDTESNSTTTFEQFGLSVEEVEQELKEEFEGSSWYVVEGKTVKSLHQ